MARTAVIVAAHLEMIEPLVRRAGYDVVGAADVAVNGERLAVHFRPDVVIVENELTGEQGWESLGHFRAASPDSQVLLVVADDWVPADRGAIGAFAVIARSHLEQLVADLADLDTWIGEQTEAGAQRDERRHAADRRLRQDWSLVGFEKRSGADRRVSA